MSKYPSTITADGDTQLCTVNRNRNLDEWVATVCASGTWGGGTITWKISPDGGSTKIALKDLSGNAVTSNADDNFNINLGAGGTLGDAPILYATMAGSTNPSVTVAVFDNN